MRANLVQVFNMHFRGRCFCSGSLARVMFVFSVALLSFSSLAEDVTERGEDNKMRLQVVTTFSVLADMVKQLGGSYVSVHTLVDWDEDAHVFQPSPEDVKEIAAADLLVLNGLGFEGWLGRLVSAADYAGPSIEATKGVNLIRLGTNKSSDADGHDDHDIHKGGVYDPHAWHSLHAARIYVDNITQALVSIDPLHAADYLSRKATFVEKLNALDLSIKAQLQKIPDSQKRLVVPHNAFAYLARDYGLHIHSLQGISTESEASAADLANIVRLIRSLNIKAIFTENTSDKRLIRVIESETNASIEGALVSGALSRALSPGYLEMMEYNSRLIIKSLTKD